ncbi:MAG: hypothetical protein P8182_03880 [Deltaproteobacteria bacterium]
MRTSRKCPSVRTIPGSLLLLCAICYVILFVALPCSAHKVNVFAYVEGGNVVVEGYFSKHRKAMDCPVEFFDAQGKKLHEGRTDKNGQYVVPLADLGDVRGDIHITLIAGQGHKNSYTLREDEIPSMKKGTAAAGPAKPASQPSGVVPRDDERKPAANLQSPKKSKQDIEEIVTRQNQQIVKMLGNIQRLLLEQENRGPSVRDIVGGIGWIFGIVGIAAYFMSRSRNRRQ